MKTRWQTVGAVLVSLILHLALLMLLFGKTEQRESTLWSGGNSQKNLAPIFVTISKSRTPNPSLPNLITPVKPTTPGMQQAQTKTASAPVIPAQSAFTKKKQPPTSGQGNSNTPRGGMGPGLDPNGAISTHAPNVLASIRKKIMRQQFYPREAREKKLSGAVRVGFKILNDGQLEYVKIIQSSGKPVLDKAALTTINKATPLPFYPEDIALSLEYLLK